MPDQPRTRGIRIRRRRWSARTKPILPLTFDQKGEAERIRVYRPRVQLLWPTAAAISLANYEANKTYFPLKYKQRTESLFIIGALRASGGLSARERYPRPIDWVLLWNAPDEFPAWSWIEANYQLVHEQGDLRLLNARGAGRTGGGEQARSGRAPD